MARKKKTTNPEYTFSKSKGIEAVSEQLGLNIYLDAEKSPPIIQRAVSEQPKVSFLNEIDINRWKDYSEVITDSLWLLGSRDKSSVHTAELHGNFIPQIPHQAMLRYTKRGDVVLDTFSGSGTTLIECKRLGRNGVGVELIPTLVQKSRELINRTANPWDVKTLVLEGDSCLAETMECVGELLSTEYGRDRVQLIIMHPPYHDIVKFSDDPRDLCNAPDTGDFLNRFSLVVKNSYNLLEDERFLVLVIGDKYSRGE